MNATDQHKAILSWEQSLVPASSLIDGRTEQDWLSFLCDYASLINFYDSKNMQRGNWTPFLLKDPVFLLANISKTRFSELHSRYLNACASLQHRLQSEKHKKDIPTAFNLLFEQLINVFIYIKQWIYFMQMTDDEYDLKTYVIYETKSNFSRYFWAILSLQQNLYLSSVIKGIKPIDNYQFYFFDAYEEVIWKQNKDKSPYWEVLNLKHPIKSNSETDFYRALKNAGDKLFVLFHTIIKNANSEFDKLKVQKSRYPDTTLLRTFVNLLKVHQDQLNGISQKHLQFYYSEILKQTEKPAMPDSVFLCSTLAKPVSTFSLPAGTLFNAGLDAQKQPILFSTTEIVDLNPATITSGYTLSTQSRPGKNSSLYLKSIPAAGVIQKDKAGKIQSWETFGGSAAPQKKIKPGIAFASPLLFLQEGVRNIQLTLQFANDFDPQSLPAIDYFLSTQNGWLQVVGKVQPSTPQIVPNNELIVLISLESTDPPIEAFKKVNPDKLDSQWPLLKLEFNSFINLAQPPVINGITIEVTVSNAKTFQLYNDYGALSTKTPYPLFGPTPLANNSFIIGNNEIFSKPFNSLVVELFWDQLPGDFQTYYQQYNNFIQPPAPPDCNFWCRIKNWFRRKSVTANNSNVPFNDSCFTVDFSLLQDSSWGEFLMTRYVVNPDASDPQKFIPAANLSGLASPAGKDVLLFVEDPQTDKTTGQLNTLAASSIFGYPVTLSTTSKAAEKGDPGIQNSSLKFTDTSQSGFIRITLSGPKLYGFGSAVYPTIVSNIALNNAIVISDPSESSVFSPPANLPFVPKLTGFTGNYSASCSYLFDPVPTETYPIQCFLYSPFTNYLVYDNSKQTNYNYTIGKSGTTSVTAGVPLFETLNYDGYLFLELENLLPSSALNLYFELARNYTNSSAGAEIGYYYISKNGWKELPLLSDGTNAFSCSGIIKVSVPDDIDNTGPAMPGTNYWFCIAVKSNAASFSQTVFLQTNGFSAQRTSSISSTGTVAPKLAANTISKPQTAIPQIATTVQPFPSFGGKAAESHTGMTQRISSRLKTKDRAISPGDYFMLIKQEFNDVYYAKPVFHPQSKSIGIYVVKAYEDWTAPGAFLPMISECKEEKITAFLNERVSAFNSISVSNFNPQYVKVFAVVTIAPGFESLDVQKSINQTLNIYLSPWITNSGPQIIIGQSISDGMVANLLRGVAGVLTVESVLFQTWTINKTNNAKWSISGNLLGEPTVAPASETDLLVSCINHHIKCE